MLLVSVDPITALVPFTVIDESSSFKAILKHTYIHVMKALPSSYHQMLSFLTPRCQIDDRGDQQVTRTCYEVHRLKDKKPAK